MAVEEVHDIVIVGGGIGGLALSLGLHRKGIKSLVLEKSEVLRAEGAALGVHANGWHALDQLGVGEELRKRSMALTGMHFEYLLKNDRTIKTFRKGRELRCLRRKDLIETLGKHVPAEQIRFSCEIMSLDFDHKAKLHVLTTRDGATIKARILIGCDGLHSIIAKSLQLAPAKFFPVYVTRGLTEYPEGHSFDNYFLRIITDKEIFGRYTIDDKHIHFWVTHYETPQGNLRDPKVIKELTLKRVKGLPDEFVDAVRNCDMDTLSIRKLGYRSPWALVHQNFRRGTMTVLGDAMHFMGPFIGQGGACTLEDAVVLTRHLSNVINTKPDTSDEKFLGRVEEALDSYIKERRPRLVKVSVQSYLVGTMIYTKSWLVKLVVIFLLSVFFRGNSLDHTLFDCGTI